MKKIVLLMMLVLAYCLPVNAGWYNNRDYGFSIFIPLEFVKEKIGYKAPGTKVIMEGVDHRNNAYMYISVCKNDDFPFGEKGVENAVKRLMDEANKKGLVVRGKDMLKVSPDHYGFYIKSAKKVDGKTINIVQAWIWGHGKEYGVFYEFPPQSGIEKELINSINSFKCDLCK